MANTVNDFIDHALAGSVSKMKDTFDTLVRKAIDKKIEAERPVISASIFNAPKLESVTEAASKYHIKFKDKSNGQWFKSKSFGTQKEMTQHFWAKIKPVAGEVQFHGPQGRLAEAEADLWEDFDSTLKEGKYDATFKLTSRKFKTKKFADEAQASDFIDRHPEYGVIGMENGLIHVAKNKSKEAK